MGGGAVPGSPRLLQGLERVRPTWREGPGQQPEPSPPPPAGLTGARTTPNLHTCAPKCTLPPPAPPSQGLIRPRGGAQEHTLPSQGQHHSLLPSKPRFRHPVCLHTPSLPLHLTDLSWVTDVSSSRKPFPAPTAPGLSLPVSVPELGHQGPHQRVHGHTCPLAPPPPMCTRTHAPPHGGDVAKPGLFSDRPT